MKMDKNLVWNCRKNGLQERYEQGCSAKTRVWERRSHTK